MKHVLTPILVGLAFLFSAGCEDNDPDDNNRNVVGTGPLVSKTFTLDDFSKIENLGVADIYVTLGNPQSVVLKAQQNIIDVMTIGVVGDELEIGLEKGISIDKADTIRFDIRVPEITSITLTGVGEYVLSGDFQEELEIILTGVGNVSAFDLEVGTCSITITGVGNCEVFVKDRLNATITGVGNIYWKGHPDDMIISITGIGNLIDAN